MEAVCNRWKQTQILYILKDNFKETEIVNEKKKKTSTLAGAKANVISDQIKLCSYSDVN
jgi:hypothetical protein